MVGAAGHNIATGTSSSAQPAGDVVSEERGSGAVGGHEKERAGETLQKRGADVEAEGRPPPGQRSRFPVAGGGQSDSLWAYEIGEDRAVVDVGVTHDAAEFTVESIRRWWKLAGRGEKAGSPPHSDLRGCGRKQQVAGRERGNSTCRNWRTTSPCRSRFAASLSLALA
jgi:Rhodopirellula transposase DDE domain